MAEDPAPARLIKKVAVGYSLNALPASLMQSFTLLRTKLARAGFKIEVVLCLLSQLPPDTDVLFVPAELVEAAHQVAPETRVVPLTASSAQQPAYNEFVQQLEAGEEIYAQRVEAEEDPSGSRRGTVVRYRGYTRLS